MNTQSWNLSSGWLTHETCPHCGQTLEIIVDAVYYDGQEAAYCAACESCGNAWGWQRTPEEALAAVST